MGCVDVLLQGAAKLGLPLTGDCAEKLCWLSAELLRWNRRINLTAITQEKDSIEKHLIDSLTLLPFFEGSERVADLGSGGGFPSLPLKVCLPSVEIVSVDAVAKKLHFQRHAARHLGLGGFTTVHARVEKLPSMGYAEGFDTVVSRAFTALGDFALLAAPLLRPEGRLIAMKGADADREIEQASSTIESLGLRFIESATLTLPFSGATRTLIVMIKNPHM